MSSDEEAWKAIEGYPGYEVSNLGNVRTFKRRAGRGKGWYISDRPTLMSPNPSIGGYLRVCISGPGGKKHTPTVHTLVLIAFIGPRPLGMVACHFDGNPANNRLSNLRWDTQKANMQDRDRNGCPTAGEGSGVCKLSNEQVREIRHLCKIIPNYAEVARQLGMSRQYVRRIAIGQVWAHLK